MSKSPARKNDKVNNSAHGDGEIITGYSLVTFENQPVACVGDTARFADGTIGEIKKSKACVMVNDRRLALVGDPTEKDGAIAEGASSVAVDEGDPFVFLGPNVLIGENVKFSCSPTFDEQVFIKSQASGQILEDYPFYIETSDGHIFSGRTCSKGALPRISTPDAGKFTIYWGDEALAKHNGEQ